MKRLFLGLAVLVGVAGGLKTEYTAYADEPIYLCDAEDMEQLKTNPNGTFALTNDIDMSGVDWEPVTFSGTLNGYGCTILNLTVSKTGQSSRSVYAANMETVDSGFAGLFDVLENANVSNLKLQGVRINIESDSNCFVGGIAGFSENSNITNCSIEGMITLKTGAEFFGTGGFVGFGGGTTLSRCLANITLISQDTNAERGNEQFMGGAFAAGYLNVNNCSIAMSGFDSNHGYIHNGGIAGQYNIYPAGNAFYGNISNNEVNSNILYFEDVADPRDHCSDAIGEMVSTYFEYADNNTSFNKVKVDDFSKALGPHNCEKAEFTEERVETDCTAFPYTLYTCTKCGSYSYRGKYELKKHKFGPGEVLNEATEDKEGLVKLTCTECNENIYLNIAAGTVWSDETTTEEPETETTAESTTEEPDTKETSKQPEKETGTTAVKEIPTVEPEPVSPESSAAENRKGGGTDIGFFLIILVIVSIPAAGILFYRIKSRSGRKRKTRK